MFEILLFIGLIISMLSYAYRIISHMISSIMWLKNPNCKAAENLKAIGQKKWFFILGGIEHYIIFGTLLASTLIIF